MKLQFEIRQSFTIVPFPEYKYVGHSINKGNFFGEKPNKFFFRFFSPKHKLCIYWNWFIAKVISISQKYFFWGYSKWWQIKYCLRDLNRGLWSDRWCLTIGKLEKFIKAYVYGEWFNNKKFTNELYILTNPSAQVNFKRSLTGLNSEYSFS